MQITPCFVHLHRMDGNLMNIYLKKYGLKVKVASGDLEKEEAHKESLPLWPGTVSKKKKWRKRKREDQDESSSKSRQKYSPNEKMEDFHPSHKYFSNSGTHKFNFNMKKPTYLEHERSSSCKFNQKKKNYLKVGSSVVKTLEEKKRRERKKMRENNKCSREISQEKVKNMMKELKKISETQEETSCSDAFAYFSKQNLKNVSKTFPTIYTCQNKSNDNNNSGILTDRGKHLKGMNEECRQFKQVVESEQKIVANVSQTEKKEELCPVGGGYGPRMCDPHHISSNVKNEALRTNNLSLSLNEEEYDSRGDDSEDDKETVIFDEKFNTLGRLKECSERVSECKQQNVKPNIKGGKLKSPRTLKRRKTSLVRIMKKEKMIIKKKLGKPTRKIGRKGTKRRQIEKTKETITRNIKFVEKFEDVLAEVSNLVKHLHDTHKIILHLKKDMEENEKLAEHFKTVIEAQQENYRKEIWRNQETIMKGYDKMMSYCKKSSTVSLEISNRTFLSVEEVENVLSRCILVENALEMLKSTQKLSAVEKNVLQETDDGGVSSCFEKEPSIRIFTTPGDTSEIIGKEPHIQIMSLDECQDHLAPKEVLGISNNLYPDDRVTPLAKNLMFSNSTGSVPCSKVRQVILPRQGTVEHSEALALRQNQSHESNHLLVPCYNSQKSSVHFINRACGQDHRLNSTVVTDFSPGGRRSDFINHEKPREDHIRSGNKVQNQLLIRQMRHCLYQQHLTKSLSQFLTNGSVQQTLTTKRPPRPQNPIPRVFQPEMEMNSKSCHQQPCFMHRPSVQRRINIESNLAVPLNPVTCDSFSQSKYSYLPHLTKSNPSMFGPYTPILGISRPFSSKNNMTSASHSMPPQKVISSHLPQFNTAIPNVSNTCSMSTSTPARPLTTTKPGLLRQLLSPPSLSKNSNSHRTSGEIESGLRVSNSMQNISSSMRVLHPIAQSSGPLNLAVEEQCYFSKTYERALQTLRENKSSIPYSSCIVPASSAFQNSECEPQLLDPTIPQKLTMKNQRLQAGAILMPPAEVTTSKSQSDEDQTNRVIKKESLDIREEVWETKKIARRHSSRKYECAQNGCKNSGIRICKGCESVIYCSGACQLNHWKQKHKEECTKLRELRG